MNLEREPDLYEPVPAYKWEGLLRDQIFAESVIESVDITLALMKPLLYHFYCLKCIQGPDTDYGLEVDHIIPQTLFNESSIERKDVIQNNLLNLGLLPKNENIAKGNKKLILIDSQWLKDQIVKYEFIPEEMFLEYSNVNNYQKMFDAREQIFLEAYTEKKEIIC